MTRTPQDLRSSLARHGVAVAAVAAALGVGLLLRPLSYQFPFTLFYAAVVVAAYYCGLRPGLLAAALSAFAADYFLLAPYKSISFLPPFPAEGNEVGAFVRVAAFLLVSALICVLTDRSRRAERERLSAVAAAGAARAASEEARAQASGILESITDGFIALDREWRFTYLNSAGARTIGRPASELVGKNLWEEFPELAETSFGRLYRRAVEENRPLELEDYYPPFDAWFHARAYPGPSGLSLYFLDVTERRRAEEAIRESEQQLRTLADTVPQLAWMAEPDGHIFWYNRRWYEYTGTTPEQMEGWGWQSVHDPEVLPRVLDRWRESLATGEPFEMEFPLKGADGQFRTFLTRVNPQRDEEGHILRWFGTNTDVDAIRRARQEHERLLAEAEAARAALVERARLSALSAEVGSALTRGDTLPQVLQLCAEALVRHLDAAFGRIWTLDARGGVLELQASAGLYTHLDGPHSRVPVGSFKIGLIAEERRPHLTNDVRNDPRIGDRAWAEREGMVAFAGYPLIVEDRLVGVMAVFARHALSEDTLQAMSSVADSISIGVERKRAEARTREQAEIIETVNRTGQMIAGELDVQKVVQSVTDAATELSGARFGSFFYNVLDERGASYMLYTLSGVPLEAFSHFPMPRATDLFGPTFRGEDTILISDVTKDARYGRNSPYYGMPEGHLPVLSYLAVPVISRSGEVLGGLFFGHPEPGVFTERAARIIEGLAAQAAVALDNARLFEAAARERQKAQASEERYRFLAESIPQIVWTSDAAGRPDYYNRRWYEYTGVAPGEVADLGSSGVIHPEDLALANERWAEAAAAGATFESELRIRGGPEGGYRWHLARAVPLRDAEGRIVKWFGTSTDIDDRKRAEESQRFLAEAGEVLVSSLDYEATLARLARLVVPRLADWCSIDMLTEERQLRRLAVEHSDPAKVRLARELERRYPPSLSDAEGVAKVLRTGEPEIYPNVPEELLALVARDSEHLKILRGLGLRSALVVPLAAQGRTMGAITLVSSESGRHYSRADLPFVEDLAHRAALAIENARLFREAQEVNRLKDEFLATLSHELRTPLTAVLGWTRLLGTGQLDPETAKRAMDTIERNAQSQVQLIDDILDVSRIIRGKLRLNVRPVELAPVIESAVDSVRPAAEAKGIRLQVVLDRQAGPVSGDPDRLQQVVWNLLSNAIKFTPKEGRVQVLLARADSQLEVTVSDTGQGIAPEFIPYVFDRFRQADPTTTRTHGGLGLGLAIARHLVELHGGTVRAESGGEGRGATFRVLLPLLAMQPAEPPAAERLPGPTAAAGPAPGNGFHLECPPELSGLRVLVVEDDADSRELLIAVLRQCGAEVLAVPRSAEALGALDTWRPDVLISDIEMPDEDGYTFIRKVRARAAERGGQIPAAALTAYARSEDRMRALAAGFQIHVPKPVEPAELVTVVASLAGRAMERQK
jgi:PAS domain S-box-containing protein